MTTGSPGAIAKHLLTDDCEAVRAALSSTGDVHGDIHAARKAIRRMRATLALLDQDAFDLERDDLALRRLGKGLSDLRDAHVVVETAVKLEKKHPAADWTVVLAALGRRREKLLQRALERDPGFGRRRRVVERILLNVRAQPWDQLHKADIRRALKRSERRARKAADRAGHEGEPEAVHRWRRRVRRLRMQLEVADAMGALSGHAHAHSIVAKKAKTLHAISDRLGWMQDLTLLRRLVLPMTVWPGKVEVLELIDSELALVAGGHS